MANMNRKLLLLLLVIAASLIAVTVVYAQDEQPGYPTDNGCQPRG